MTSFPLALDGIRVIDLSRVIAGPWCGALLGDLGADVIKVEDTGGGDESRTWPPHKDGEAAAYLLFNRNKRAMTLDLKTPEGVEVVKALVRGADVLLENFRTGTMESFGLGYEGLSEINPRLIYCSVSAFGRTGPRKDGAGYEALMQAFSGIMSITGEPDGPPPAAPSSMEPPWSPVRRERPSAQARSPLRRSMRAVGVFECPTEMLSMSAPPTTCIFAVAAGDTVPMPTRPPE